MTVSSIDPMDRIPVQVYRHPVEASKAVASQIEWAVPLSPSELDRKRSAIFKHESQKDRALFPGPDNREFWQRAEQRNCERPNSTTVWAWLSTRRWKVSSGAIEASMTRPEARTACHP